MAQRVKVVVALIGSQASTLEGLTGIASKLGYALSLEKNSPLLLRLRLRSKSVGFTGLATEIAAEQVARLGTVRFGDRLWPSEVAIHQTIAAKPAHRAVTAETKILEGLLPAQFNVETRYELAI